jgi:hypothetical protein
MHPDSPLLENRFIGRGPPEMPTSQKAAAEPAIQVPGPMVSGARDEAARETRLAEADKLARVEAMVGDQLARSIGELAEVRCVWSFRSTRLAFSSFPSKLPKMQRKARGHMNDRFVNGSGGRAREPAGAQEGLAQAQPRAPRQPQGVALHRKVVWVVVQPPTTAAAAAGGCRR